MLISEAFPSEFLKAADLHDRQHTVVMDHIEMREVGDGNKPVLFFRDRSKGLVLNKTNGNNIALVYGDETDDWSGQEVIIYPTMVDFQGRSVPAIRVKAQRIKPPIRTVEAYSDRNASRELPEHPPRNGTIRPGAKTSAIARDLQDDVPF
jgi:hypothetical protein